MAALEKKVEDREIKIINANVQGQSLRQLLQKIDEEEEKRLSEMKLTEDKLEVAQGQAAALKFLGEQEKNSKFQNKRYAELSKLI